MKSSLTKEQIAKVSAIGLRRVLDRIQERKLEKESQTQPSDKKES